MRVVDTFHNSEYEIMITHHNRYHPAKFSDRILDVLASVIPTGKVVLDICSGVGRLGLIKERGWSGTVIGQEIEPEWALQACYNKVDIQYIADATVLENYHPYRGVDIVCTSVTYGNRLADHHNAKDGSIRFTYKHCIGRDLHDNNTGRFKYTQPTNNRLGEYKELHKKIWTNVATLDVELLVLNVSNFIRAGKEVDVTGWHLDYLNSVGFSLIEKIEIKTPRLRVGQNRNLRTGCEYVCLLKKR